MPLSTWDTLPTRFAWVVPTNSSIWRRIPQISGKTILDILCAHIRRTTEKKEYRQVHHEKAHLWQVYASKPSEEIQSLLTLLFVEERKAFKSCRINLQGSWLKGAKLRRAHLHGAQFEKAHLQGANLQHARFHGDDLVEAGLQLTYLFRSQLQGTSLANARLQGAMLAGAQLQESEIKKTSLPATNLNRACLQGIHYKDNTMLFSERMRAQIGIESESGIAIFAGGVSQEEVDSLIEDLPNENQKCLLRERLALHIGREESRQIPGNSGALTGAYTKEEAEQWIAEYEEAMSEVPKTANGQ